MPSLRVVGSSPWDDLYPNIKHRVAQIQSMSGYQVTVDIARLKPKGHTRQGALHYLNYGLRTLKGVLGLCLRARRSRADLIYVTYPAPPVLLLLRLLGVHRRSLIHADVFISISETLIHDRQKIKGGSLLAKVIIGMERVALSGVVCLVDTPENATYLAAFLNLPVKQFKACPLALVPREDLGATLNDPNDQVAPSCKNYAYFVGTLVPLQGVPTIVQTYEEASRQISSPENLIPLVVRGDGQDAPAVRQLLDKTGASSVEWRDELAESTTVEEEITGSRICIGIFGRTEKAQRVIPFKIYQYLRAGRAVLTLDTPALRRLERQFLEQFDGPSPLILIQSHNLQESMITYLSSDPTQLAELEERSLNAIRCFDALLADTAGIQCLKSVFSNATRSAT